MKTASMPEVPVETATMPESSDMPEIAEPPGVAVTGRMEVMVHVDEDQEANRETEREAPKARHVAGVVSTWTVVSVDARRRPVNGLIGISHARRLLRDLRAPVRLRAWFTVQRLRLAADRGDHLVFAARRKAGDRCRGELRYCGSAVILCNVSARRAAPSVITAQPSRSRIAWRRF